MRLSLTTLAQKATKSYSPSNRTDWVLSWPGQIVIAGSQIHWTLGAEKAINKEGARGLKKYHQKLQDELNQTVEVYRYINIA